MADEQRLHDLLDLVEQARAEGDKDTEEKAIRAYRQESMGASLPTEAPNASGGILNRIGSTIASVTDPVGDAAANAMEGAYRNLVQGPGQLVSAIADAVGNASGLAPNNGILKNYNEAVKMANDDTEQEYVSSGGTVMPKTIKAGEVVSAFVYPTGVLSAPARSLLGTLRLGAASGAIGAAISDQPDADTVGDKALFTAEGGVLGALVGTVPLAGNGMKNVIRRYLTGNPIPGVPEAAQTAQEAFPGLKGQLTMGQQTGNVRTIQTESKFAEATAQKQWQAQADAVRSELKNITDTYGPVLPAETAVERGQFVMRNVVNGMRATRKALWDSDLNAIKAKVTADTFSQAGVDGTSQVAVEMPGLADAIKQVRQNFDGAELSPRLQSMYDELTKFGGHLSFDTLEKALRDVNGSNFNVLQGLANPAVNGAAASQMKAAIMKSIEGMGTDSEIGAMLNQMRSGYAARSQAIQKFQSQAAAKILKIKPGDVVSDPDKAVSALLNMGDSETTKFATLLSDKDPALLSHLRNANLKQGVDAAMNASAPAGAPTFDVKKFINATVDNGKLRNAGLYRPGEAETLKKNVESLSVLLNAAPYRSTPIEAEGAVMSIASMSTAFLTRTLYRLAGAGKLEAVLFDPKSRAVFQDANKAIAAGYTGMAAQMISHLADRAPSDDE